MKKGWVPAKREGWRGGRQAEEGGEGGRDQRGRPRPKNDGRGSGERSRRRWRENGVWMVSDRCGENPSTNLPPSHSHTLTASRLRAAGTHTHNKTTQQREGETSPLLPPPSQAAQAAASGSRSTRDPHSSLALAVERLTPANAQRRRADTDLRKLLLSSHFGHFLST